MENQNLLDTLHRCLRCDELAYEEENNKYSCSECDFTWEVDNIEADEGH
jgi:ribosomal protein L37E